MKTTNEILNDTLEDLQEALVLAGGKFFRREELLNMPVDELFAMCISNKIKLKIKFISK